MQKNATPTRLQQETICRAGLKPDEWTVIKDMLYRMIIFNRATREVKRICK